MMKSALKLLSVVLVLFPLFTACGGGDDPVPAFTVNFAVTDEDGSPISGADFYLNDETTPIATTGSAGTASFSMTGNSNTLSLIAAGYHSLVGLNRDYSLQTDYVAPMAIQTYTTGTASISLSATGGPAGQPVIISSRSKGNAANLIKAFGDGSGGGTGTDAGGIITSQPAGTHYGSFVTSDMTLAGSATSYGETGGFAVASGAMVTAPTVTMASGGREFMVSATGGFTGAGAMVSYGYTYYGLDYFRQMVASNSAGVSGVSSLSGQAMTVPSNATYLDGNRTFYLRTISYDSTVPLNGRHFISGGRFFHTRAELDAEPLALSMDFVDYGISSYSPAHNDTNVSTTPTFTHSFTNTTDPSDFVRIQLYEVLTDGAGTSTGTRYLARLSDYGKTGSVSLPANISLEANKIYAYQLEVRKFSDSDFNRTYITRICFSTGAATPTNTAAGYCN